MSAPRIVASLAVLAVMLAGAPAARADSRPTDVLFVVDTTGSMSDALAEAKDQVGAAVATLQSRYADLDFGLAEVRDYGNVYGDTGDEPWSLDVPMTKDRTRLEQSVDGLVAGGGGDGPEAYGRALYESDVNTTVGWRAGARRLLVLVADDVPHDDDLNAGIPSADQVAASPLDTGADPGPDGLVGTADDLDWQAVLQRLKTDGLPLLFVYYHGDSSYLPYWQAWAAITGGRAGSSDDGKLGDTIGDIISQSTTGCSRTGKSVGIVSVCADHIVSAGGTYTATGNVALQGGVGVGDGPITLDESAGTISSAAAVPLSVLRSGGPLAIGSGVLNVAAAGETEPISARKLAKLTLAGFTPGSLPAIGGVSVAFDAVSQQTLYLDDAEGGGVVAALTPAFDLLGSKAAGQFAVASYAQDSLPLTVIGGSVGWDGAKLPGGWKIGSLKLGYTPAGDVWSLSGGVSFPFFKGIGGVDVEGALRGGRVDVIGLVLHTQVPLADTGFVFDSFGGKLEGLAGGPGNPVKITASTSGYYGELPPPIDHVFWLKGAALTIDTSGGASLNGEVAFGTEDGRYIKGKVGLGFRIDPFQANGSAEAEAHLLGFDGSFKAAAAVTAHHFTASGSASGSFHGISLGSADGIISDRGIGVVAHPPQVCVWIPFSGTHCTPGSIGFGAAWSELPHVHSIGDDLGQYKTARAAAAGRRVEEIRVPRGKPYLFVDGVGTGAPPEFDVVPPHGRPYRTTRAAPRFHVVRDAALHATSVSIGAPRPGRWRIVNRSPAPVSWSIQDASLLTPLRVTLNLASSHRHPLSASRSRRLRVRWTSQLGPHVDVRLYVSTKRRSLGRQVRDGLSAHGSASVPHAALRPGANYVHLVAFARGIGLDSESSRAIWLPRRRHAGHRPARRPS